MGHFRFAAHFSLSGVLPVLFFLTCNLKYALKLNYNVLYCTKSHYFALFGAKLPITQIEANR